MARDSEFETILVGIPTRDRPEHLAALLGTLFFQTYQRFDVLIVDSGSKPAKSSDQVQRVVNILGIDHTVTFIRVQAAGFSSVVPTNRLIMEAVDREYDWLFKIDDDHILPPNTLMKLLGDAKRKEKEHPDSEVVISGVTPWAHKVWEGASGPLDGRKSIAHEPLSYFKEETSENGVTKKYSMVVGHFDRYETEELVETQFPSAANFLIRPKVPILWADIGPRCLWADVIWFLQLKCFLGYNFYVNTGIDIWHMVASTGGCRDGQFDYVKGTEVEEKLRGRELDRFITKYESLIWQK